MKADATSDVIYDVIGVGFGPSNLALAIAIGEYNDEHGPGTRLNAAFLEQQEEFGWHRGMLLDGASMQVSFIKDLVTPRRPVSEFSFLNFLHECGRLPGFINHKSLYPTRREFHDYLRWAAARFDDSVTYGTEVVDVRPVPEGDRITCLDVIARRPCGPAGDVVLRARNLVIGTGLAPAVPPGARRAERVWHSSELLHRLRRGHGTPRCFVVAGSGQSGAEVAAYLHDRFTEAEVHPVLQRYGYSLSDDSSFVNQIFDPAAVDEFYYAPQPVREAILRYHANTNYSVVDADLINRLYAKTYTESMTGRRRLLMHRMSRISSVVASDESVEVMVEHLASGQSEKIMADALIYATGYEPTDPLSVLGAAALVCKQDSEGRVRVERDYRIATSEHVQCGIYLQGGTEHSHGISSTLLSNIATRAGEIVHSLLERG